MSTLEAANPVCVAMAIPFPDLLWKVLERGGGKAEEKRERSFREGKVSGREGRTPDVAGVG
jgi:hypothetical protein